MEKQLEHYETPDMDEFLKDVVKRFCPNCGQILPVMRNGRPRVYCSDRCRKAFWNIHPRADTWQSYETMLCPVCGRVFRAKRIRTRKRKYCSRTCASRSRFLDGRNT